MKKRYIIKKCSIEDFNSLLKRLKKFNRVFLLREPEENEEIGRFKVFLYKKAITCCLVYKELKGSGKVVQYQTKLDDSFNGVEINGTTAFAILQKFWKAPETNTKETAPFSVGITPYRNKKFVGKRVEKAYGYDLNSAYPYGMLQNLPDTTKPLGPGKVKKDEYGLSITGYKVKVGEYAIFRFPLMETPYKRFIEVEYAKKKNATNIADKNSAKFIMNAAIGALQNHNCYLRAAIISNFYEIIDELKEKYGEHIISSNVDSIVSDIRIPEIEENLGNEIGQWKLEHTGSFAIAKNAYSVQWNLDKPAYGAGLSKDWFPDGWDILKDELPKENNKYVIDTKKLLLVENKKHEEKKKENKI